MTKYSEKEARQQWVRLVEALNARGLAPAAHELERSGSVWRWQVRNADSSVSVIDTYVGTSSQVWETFLSARRAVLLLAAP